MQLPLYQVDAFTQTLFCGNPAAIVPLAKSQAWPADDTLLKIAQENNVSETAYFQPLDDGSADFQLRWFTPDSEIDLCGHATLASAFVLFEKLGFELPQIRFQSRSGILLVTREANGMLTLDFPSRPAQPSPTPAGLLEALGFDSAGVAPPRFCGRARDWLLVLEQESDVAQLQPDFRALQAVTEQAVIVSAPGDKVDFVSRFFTPTMGIDEDPVTGSAHCTLIPYWAEQLNKRELSARQISARGGDLQCRLEESRVFMSGQAVCFLEGQICI